MNLTRGFHEVVIDFTAVDGRVFQYTETIQITAASATPYYGIGKVTGLQPLLEITGDNAIGDPKTGNGSVLGLVPLTEVTGEIASIATPNAGLVRSTGLTPLAHVIEGSDYVTITNAVGNIASGTTTLTLVTNLDLEAQASIVITKGGIVCANITVLSATTISFTEPTDGLQLNVNHPVIIETEG